MDWKGVTTGVRGLKIIKRDPKSRKRGLPKSSKSQNWFADHPSTILKRPPPFSKRPDPIFAIFSAAKYCKSGVGPLGKGWEPLPNGRGVIGKPILGF